MDIYKRTITRFPLGSAVYMFAYGSGVKHQKGYDKTAMHQSIIDLIFCVRDPQGFHAENMKRHPSHYSALRHLGPIHVSKYQERLGAGVYFNTLVPLDDIGIMIKYGVVSEDTLIQDLLEWKHLYLAGRLHKPVQNLMSPNDNIKLKTALDENLMSAFQTALLMLPSTFTAFELFHTIAGLSYKGDFRMIFGENKQKVRNIVQPLVGEFLELYQPVMQLLVNYVAVNMHGREPGSGKKSIIFEQDKSDRALRYHLRRLPKQLRRRLERNAAFRGSYMEIVDKLAMAPNLHDLVQMSVNDIVWRSSVTQSLKNIASAGVIKSLVYSYRKAVKTFAV